MGICVLVAQPYLTLLKRNKTGENINQNKKSGKAPVVKVVISSAGHQLQSLVRELRSHMPCVRSVAKIKSARIKMQMH